MAGIVPAGKWPPCAAYNPGMFRRALSLAAALACAAAAAAQTPPTHRLEQQPPKLEGRKNQKVEKIHVEDGRNSIDEVRYGGQTESIHVQPKVPHVPGYEIVPEDLAHARPNDSRSAPAAAGQRVWNVFSF
jgi:hypothetical protein